MLESRNRWKERVFDVGIGIIGIAAILGACLAVWAIIRWLLGLLPFGFVAAHRGLFAAAIVAIITAILYGFRVIIVGRELAEPLGEPEPPPQPIRSALASREQDANQIFTSGRGARCERAPEIDIPIPDSVKLDATQFTITAPRTAPPRSTFELIFWVHRADDRDVVRKRAKEVLDLPDEGILFTSEGPFQLQRGSILSVRVTIQGLLIRPRQKTVLWIGEIGNATFTVGVPNDAIEGPHVGVASIRADGAQIATMHFVLDVGRPADIDLIPATLTMHRNAFASYASEDRDHVIARVQGMEKAGMNVFVDVMTLRSGEDWETKLWRVIPESDVFYLFWCRHAKNSPWVEKEWRCALRERGLDFIDPVPLEAPEHATPPLELASKHFNDPLLYFLSSRDHPLKSSSAST